jgi:DNA-binding PadR family transcriptional regulator
MHGWGITELIEQRSADLLSVNQGSLYPALYRLVRQRKLRSEWRTTANNRRARYYEHRRGAPATRRRTRPVGSPVARRQSRAQSGGGRMSPFGELWARIRALGERDDLERDMDEELRFHLSMATERNIARGLPPDEARRRALLQFGGVEHHKEVARGEQWSRWLENAWQDVRYAGRTLRRNPRFASAVILTLALGMGVTTAIFSVVDPIVALRSE